MNKKDDEFKVDCKSSTYNFVEEVKRYAFPTITKHGMQLNRGKSEPFVVEKALLRNDPQLEKKVVDNLFPTTLSKKSALVDISLPYTGHYYCSKGGIYFDADIGVGQKLIDDQHPEIKKTLNLLIEHNALIRRESITNDVMITDYDTGIKSPQDLAELFVSQANKAFSQCAPYKAYFSTTMLRD